MTIAAFLIAMVGPLLSRILVSLGVSLITITGLTVVATTLKGQVTGAIGGMPAAVVQLGGLFGLWEAGGMIFGTITFLIAWKGTSGFMALAKV
ncbi:MAG: DUF2523 family protein [Candidatus Binatia bacterium]